MTDRFTEFLQSLVKDTYPEPPSEIHEKITAEVLPPIVAMCPPGARVLDVGCGQGVALKRFKEFGCEAVGITTNAEDLEVCRNAGFEVRPVDMHSLLGGDEWLDLIWARHVLEHSPAPMFALHEFKRVLKPGGLLYIEVPVPMTACRHEFNPNHYSVLTCSMWQALIAKAGFTLIEGKARAFGTQAGPDEYRSYLCRK